MFLFHFLWTMVEWQSSHSTIYVEYLILNICNITPAPAMHTYIQGWCQCVCSGNAKCVATAATWEWHIVFHLPSKMFNFKMFSKYYHNGVGVSSSCTWLTTELTSKKKKKKKKKKKSWGGGGREGNCTLPPPLRGAAPAYIYMYQHFFHSTHDSVRRSTPIFFPTCWTRL